MKDSVVHETISAGFASLFLCVLTTVIVLFFNFTNIFGYFNPGFSFTPFPSKTDSSFDRALTFLRDAPFSGETALQKWTAPIKLRFEGIYSDKDIDALHKIIGAFNTVPGFPGITLVDSGENVLLSYIKSDQFEKYKTKYSADADHTSFCKHYSSGGAITSAVIVICCDGLQGYRNSTVLHEFTHLAGFFNHTSFRDSILNTVGPVPGLSPTDLLALKMIYNPDIKPLSTYDSIAAYYSTADIASFAIKGNVEKPYHWNVIPIITGILLLLIFFPFRKGKKKSVQFARLLSAFIVYALYFFILNNFAADTVLSLFR